MEILAKTLALTLSLFLCSSSLLVASATSNQTDKLSLLEFKSQIARDPLEVLSSWNDSVHFCRWIGVNCARSSKRVISLRLPSLRLEGTLPASIGNLTFLRVLDIQNNDFRGKIPQQIGNLNWLEALGLENNTFTGQIPTNISNCRNLQSLRLGGNELVGEVPEQLGSLGKLRELYIAGNHLSGEIPPSIGNLSSLEELLALENEFVGEIPETLGQLKNMHFVSLGFNRLSGEIPPSIFNSSSLVFFYVPGNQLRGSLPSDLGFTLPNLQHISVGLNHFTGPIPRSISNATNLMRLTLAANNFSGKMPTFENLYNLSWVSISRNHLGTGEDDDFITSLFNATSLQLLAINENNFGGRLPESVGNWSNKLSRMYLGDNQLIGSISSSIGNLRGLETLYLGNNRFSGSISPTIGNLQNLRESEFHGNMFSGAIPSSLGNLTLLTTLILTGNRLQGRIPPSLGRCQSLILLDLSSNNISGAIPPEVVSISSLAVYLDLSRNKLNGFLPPEVGNLINLVALDVSENRLSGEIPSTLGRCVLLENLIMKGNSFQGSIPSSFSSMRGLQSLDLSRNSLNGTIPKFLGDFSFLESLNLSYNHLEGEVPKDGVFANASAVSLAGNEKLCDGISELKLPTCMTRRVRPRRHRFLKLILPILLAAIFVILMLLLVIRFWLRRHKPEKSSEPSPLKSLLRVSYHELRNATGGFSSSNLIGSGRFSWVYKGILDGKTVAVKVINLRVRGASRSFLAESEALRNIRHRNLVIIETVCASIDHEGNEFKALVYEFKENGSLDEWLHPSQGATRSLSLLQRLGIAVDVASALSYLHFYCQPQIVHRDVKPSNVLLDGEFTAHVCDFGISRLLREESTEPIVSALGTNSTAVQGTFGYTAPEYGMGSGVSTSGDTFSFGILLLEMFTGRRPTDEMFCNGLNLHNYVEAALPEKLEEIIDPVLLLQDGERRDETKECLVSILEIGLSCSAEAPGERRSVSDAEARLCSIKNQLLRTQRRGRRETKRGWK